ncbi:MAG: hypothetical protein LBV38_04635 [Alistipes sp.]|jgi:hypothetical protein|nr:hypothetical protein [Alistipes sp.]
MRKTASSDVVEDIWMNTQASADDLGHIAPTGPESPASWEEVEESNLVLNPDPFSMGNRG